MYRIFQKAENADKVVDMATRADWAKRLQEWKKSGLTAAEFAKRAGTTSKRLYWWNWSLRRQEKAAAGTHASVSQERKLGTTEFLPLLVLPKRKRAEPDVRASYVARVEIGFGNGYVLRGEAMDARWIAELIVAVDGARRC